MEKFLLFLRKERTDVQLIMKEEVAGYYWELRRN